MYVGEWYAHMRVVAHRVQKTALDSSGTGVDRQLGAAMWVLGTELRSSERAVSALTHWDISPALSHLSSHILASNTLKRWPSFHFPEFWTVLHGLRDAPPQSVFRGLDDTSRPIHRSQPFVWH